MVIEYLFLTDNLRNKVKEYIDSFASSHDEFVFFFIDSENSTYWILRCELTGGSETTAKKLSDLDEIIINSFSPITLINEASAYFNKKLYPLVNSFERHLRTFVYIKAAMCNDPALNQKISKLEEKDFGEITNILFVDSSFLKEAKDLVKTHISRSDLIDALEKIPECTNWSKMVTSDSLESVQKRFNQLKEYRNDVMHAHNINFQRYKEIKHLYESVNSELSKDIDSTVKLPDNAINTVELANAMKDLFHWVNNYNENNDNVKDYSNAFEYLIKAIKNTMGQSEEN